MRPFRTPWGGSPRPPEPTGEPLTGTHRQVVGDNPRGGNSISRADTAHTVLDGPATTGGPVGTAY